MQLKSETAERVAATPPSQRVSATSRRQFQRASHKIAPLFSRDEGVARAFCDGGVAATRTGNGTVPD